MTRRTRRYLYLLVAVGAAVLIGAGGTVVWCERGLSQARGLAKYGLWPDARRAVTRYLWVHPRDTQARLLCAETLIKDEQLPADRSAPQALVHLQAIPDTAPEGARARTQEGRLELFLLYHPTRAEQLLRRALELDPATPEPYYLLWKLKDLTGRSHLAESEFWKVYEATVVDRRVLRLREWYMSQFYPTTANPVLDRLMGFVAAKKSNPELTEAFRFIRFRNEEPESALCHAALARWYQNEGDARLALESLDQAQAKIQGAEQDPFYLATLISILIEMGELDRADRCFQQWPEPHTGYEYWLAEGQVLQEVRGQYAEACRAYDLALGEWPGTVDWRTRNRKANCLARMRDQAGAARERAAAKVMEQLMDEKIHQRLRYALGFLNDPKCARELVDFYQKIGRPREAAAWSEHIARLQTQSASEPQSPAPKGG
jgi:tetratricopeptide (TPR) repeat protein